MSAPLCGLPKAAALDSLARTIYYAYATVYDREAPHWEGASAEERQRILRIANEVLERVDRAQPNPLFDLTVNLSRAEAAKVVLSALSCSE